MQKPFILKSGCLSSLSLAPLFRLACSTYRFFPCAEVALILSAIGY